MWEVYKDGKFIKSFENKEDAYKYKDASIDNDIKKHDLGHRYRVERKGQHTIPNLIKEAMKD